MKKVYQSKLYSKDAIHNGNCYSACLASLLEVPLWMVPPFEDMFGRGHGEWADRSDQWLKQVFSKELIRIEGHSPDLPEFYIANGLSARGVYHSVVYSKGKLAHDPHPTNQGIISVEWTWHLESR